MFNVIGRTTEGLDVVTGVYRFFETHGLPLDVIYETLRETRNAIPCWTTLCRDAVAAGQKLERVLARMENDLSDVYGPDFAGVVLQRLRDLNAKGELIPDE